MSVKRVAQALMLSLAVLSASTQGQSYDRQAVRMFKELHKQPNLLAKYRYLESAVPELSFNNRIFALQMMAFTLSEMGLYSQAVLAFPLKMRPIENLVLPDVESWKKVDALREISEQAANRQIILINEVHHNAQTRALTLELLPRLRNLGFTYLAIEALGHDPDLVNRGYPERNSGTEYLQEPIYGEIVREAIRLGFVLVPYDDDKSGTNVEARETNQARNLFDKVFVPDPGARLVVAAGYAHVDKNVGRLGRVQPMAMVLKKLTGIDPLSIDQSQFLETEWTNDDQYHRLISRFPTSSPEVLVNRKSGAPWSAAPRLYDISVISPPSLPPQSFGQDVSDPTTGRYRHIRNVVQMTTQAFVAFNEMQRPTWLDLEGRRRPYAIDTRLCREQIPCIVVARYEGESEQATPADIYAFLKSTSSAKLYLKPGRYRLRAWNEQGRTLSQATIVVPEL